MSGLTGGSAMVCALDFVASLPNKNMTFDELFSHSHALPTIPKVVHELINDLQNERISIAAVARKIELDQVMAGKLLRLANSAYYGLSNRVSSVDKAIHMLGFSTTRTLVVSVGIS